MRKHDQLSARFPSRSQLGLNLGDVTAAHSAITEDRSPEITFSLLCPIGSPTPSNAGFTLEQLLKCLLRSNLNCPQTEPTFGLCFPGALHTSGQECPPLETQPGMTPQWTKPVVTRLLFLGRGPLTHTSAPETAPCLAGANLWPLCWKRRLL